MNKDNYWQIKKEFIKKYNQEFLPFIKNVKILQSNYFQNYAKKAQLYNKIKDIEQISNILVIVIIFASFFLNLLFLQPSLRYKFSFMDHYYPIGLYGESNIFFLIQLFSIFCFGVLYLSGYIYELFYLSMFKEYEENIDILKKMVMPKLCDCIGNISWKQNIYSDFFSFLPAFNEITFNVDGFDDVFLGKTDEFRFDIVQSNQKVNRKTRALTQKFILIKIKFLKLSNNHTIIRKNNKFSFSKIIEKCKSKYNSVILEDVLFIKQFDVTSTNQVEARCFLTPTFIEKIINIEKTFKSKLLQFACYRGDLYIMLEAKKDLFEPVSLEQDIDNKTMCLEFFDEIISIYKMIDYLKLNAI